MAVREEDILEALKVVIDPDLKKDIVSLGFIKEMKIAGSSVSFDLELTTPACPLKAELEKGAREAALSVAGVEDVKVNVTSSVRKAGPGGMTAPKIENLIPSVKNVIAIASGKGGVGKSTVSVNLSLAMAAEGAKVGLLDLDIYGPSIPMMMGAKGQPKNDGGKMVPIENHGVRMMSLGFLVPDGAPLIWRGPMVMSAVEQLLKDVAWGDLDYLFIDLPPGTGDAQLSLTQKAHMSGAVIVTTPQDVALLDATKGLAMFKKVNVDVLGIIENMSFYLCPNCGERSEIFSHGGARKASEKEGVPFLGEIPINVNIREGGDSGKPIVIADPEGPLAERFREMAKALAARISIQSFQENQENNAATANQ
ncbi:MAG: iron-sulfur cluster carrier protein ApbC [Deltaproteobacteria bacterium]|nr:iron-sulfur cluster carrier protein ApbC [Deltaproteobacteria bacterium]